MRIASFNVNGIRAAERRGFGEWLGKRRPDVVALQEVRCPVEQLPRDVFADYHLAYHAGSLAGRNGVAVLTRTPPLAVRGWDADVLRLAPADAEPAHSASDPSSHGLARELRAFAAEGRYVEVDLADHPLTVASVYVPKGGLPPHLEHLGREAPDGGVRYRRKQAFMAGFARQLSRSRRAALARGREFLVLGDFNVAHTQLDLTNWRTSNRAVGFLPEERAWIDSLIQPRTLVDVVRRLHPEEPGPYSWWSWFGTSFDNNVGWRIDYHLASPRLAKTALRAGTDRDAAASTRISDHAPVVVDYAL